MITIRCQCPRLVPSIKRSLQTSSHLHKQNAISSTSRQVKVFEKLLGNRQSGSKKRWYPNENQPQPSQSQITSIHDIGKTQGKQGKSASRRVSVLNKLFMKHITDQLATGTLSDQILGKGLEISRVKITPDFHAVNVYWIARGGAHSDAEVDAILHRCSGILRHELSQLRLMGEVPRIHFVKDKTYANLAEVEYALKKCDFDDDAATVFSKEEQHDAMQQIGVKDDEEEDDLPVMRHDVLGLNHKGIMSGILAKMRKSKEAWSVYEMRGDEDAQELPPNHNNTTTPKLDTLRVKLDDERTIDNGFQKFLNSRNFKQNKPERKRPIHVWDDRLVNDDGGEYSALNCKEDDDYMEDVENRKC